MSARLSVVSSALSLLLGGCAWSNPENRPVWNAFEHHVVPDSDGLFYATLPVTVPLGLAAIVTDVVVAHPIQVLDDAYGDAGELWRAEDFDWEGSYYTEMALLPFRAVATPITFGVSFAGRAVFDIPPRPEPLTPEERAAREAAEAEREERHERARSEQRRGRRELLRAWLESGCRLAQGMPTAHNEWHPDLDEPLRAALAGDADTRRRLHRRMLDAGHATFGVYSGELGLRDPDPVVRFTAVRYWPLYRKKPSGDARAAVLADPVESVRLMAAARF